MTANPTVTISREDLDKIASGFTALKQVIVHCDSTCAEHVASIFEKFAFDLLDEVDRATPQHQGGD